MKPTKSSTKPARTTKSNHNAAMTLTVHAPTANQVYLAGTFNGWEPHAIPMERTSDGDWKVALALPPGRYEYKFVVDDRWCCQVKDEGPVEYGDNCVPNEHGTMNCVLEIPAGRD